MDRKGRRKEDLGDGERKEKEEGQVKDSYRGKKKEERKGRAENSKNSWSKAKGRPILWGIMVQREWVKAKTKIRAQTPGEANG